jgi:hypothetical protein
LYLGSGLLAENAAATIFSSDIFFANGDYVRGLPFPGKPDMIRGFDERAGTDFDDRRHP